MKKEIENVLVIPDLHAPFIKKDFLEHCKEVKTKYKCKRIVFLGDLIDNHYSSYHETDPDGMSANDELNYAISVLKPFYKAFPEASVCIGNHDRIIMRKAYSAGLSKRWIKDFKDVLETPKWNFDLQFEINKVIYMHGEGGGGINGALTKCLNRRKSIVQGHFHTEAHIRWNVSDYDRLFVMQVGCGIDDKAYAMNYAKFNLKKSIISCGVVLNEGKLPIIIPMDL